MELKFRPLRGEVARPSGVYGMAGANKPFLANVENRIHLPLQEGAAATQVKKQGHSAPQGESRKGKGYVPASSGSLIAVAKVQL